MDATDPLVMLLIINLTLIMTVSTAGFLWAIVEIKRLHRALNGRLDQMLRTLKASSFAEGAEAERARHDGRNT